MAAESTQKKLGRIRPPRVQITYDVEIGDAIIMKQLPYVVGIMADLSGNPEQPLPKLKDRKFVYIDRDNINDILASSNSRVTFQAQNKLTDEDKKLNIALTFNSLDDFEPTNIIHQVPALRKLFEARRRLADLLTKLDGNDDLDGLLQQVLENTDELQTLKPEEAAEEAPAEEAPAEG
ncbi:MAG: type VI secretion system contractile sheath small subunit [Desulfovibrionaceae bacterium]